MNRPSVLATRLLTLRAHGAFTVTPPVRTVDPGRALQTVMALISQLTPRQRSPHA